jgi:hypothetical protein
VNDDIAEIEQNVQDYQAGKTVVTKSSDAVAANYQIARFRGRAMLMVKQPFPHYVPLHKERFDQIAYPILGGVSRSRMNDVFSYLCNAVVDLTANDRYILFGISLDDLEIEADTDVAYYAIHKPTVWDMEELQTIQEGPQASRIPADACVWRSPYAKWTKDEVEGSDVCDKEGRLNFIMQLAGGDEGVYGDILQSIAPLVMAKKPDGVIWWVGAGANGKSTLMDAIYKIFPGQLSSITVKRLVDGRDTPSLNGTLANIVKESSEGRVEDTEVYKSIGTHENFRVHKFHSQDDIEIRGNLHHIFSANMIPSFNDKGYAARRRTFIIPFNETFESDPSFEEKTFTPEFFGRLIVEMCKYANNIKRNNYRYKWSAATRNAKAEYDAEASNAEEYAKEIVNIGVIGFEGFGPLKVDYENWCADNGFVPLGMGNLRRAMQAYGFERLSVREGKSQSKQWRLRDYPSHEAVALGMGRPGLFVLESWADEAREMVEKAEAKKAEASSSTPKPEPEQKSILDGKW